MATRQTNPVLRHIRELASESRLTRLTDRQLLERFTAHADHAAFEALVRRHGPMVLRVCRSVLRDEHAADDAFQATFLVLARKAASLRRQEMLASWLYGVAHRVAARARVEAAKRLNREARAEVRTARDPAAELSTREVCAALEEELGRLPERYRTPFYLCHVEGRTRDQAARQLGCSVRTLQRLLERGRGLLQARLSGRGVSLPAALLAATLAHGQGSAALPAALLEAALTVARAAATGAAVPVKVAALAKGVLRRMAATRLKVFAVLALVAATAGAALVAQPGSTPEGLERSAESSLARSAQPQPATDLYGDPLPPGARLRLGSLRLRAGGPIFALRFTPDGKGLFSGAFTQTARLWDTDSGKELRRFDVPQQSGETRPNNLSSLALSRNGRTLAGGTTAGSVYLWEAATGQLLRTLAGGRERILAVALTPDGKLLASAARPSGQPAEIILWDTRAGKEVRRLKDSTDEIDVLAFAPGGKVLASGGADKAVRLWDVATGQPLRVLRGLEKRAGSLAFSPDGKTLAASSSYNSVRLWEVSTGAERPLRDQTGRPYGGVAFSPDGKVLAAGGSADIFLWDAHTGAALPRVLEKGDVRCLAFADRGGALCLARGYADGTVRLWDLPASAALLRLPAGAPPVGRPRLALGHQSGIYAVAVAPGGKVIATGGDDATVRLWDAGTGKELHRWHGHTRGVSELYYSRDGKLLISTGHDGQVLLREAATGKAVRRLVGRCVALSPDGKLMATATNDQAAIIQLWDLATGQERRRLLGHKAGVNRLTFSPDGKTLASGGIGVFDAPKIDNEESEVHPLRLWDVATGKLRFRFGDPHEHISNLAFTPDGKTLISGGASRGAGERAPVRLWETATGRERDRLLDRGTIIWSLALAPDGRTLAVGSYDGPAPLWDLPTRQEIRTLGGHRGWVTAVAFSPDGRTLVTGSWDTTALVWDVADLVGRRRLPKIDREPHGR